jgi:hypothetical protein
MTSNAFACRKEGHGSFGLTLTPNQIDELYGTSNFGGLDTNFRFPKKMFNVNVPVGALFDHLMVRIVESDV